MFIRINQSISEKFTSTQLSQAVSDPQKAKKRFLKKINPTAALSYVSITVLILSVLSIGYNTNQQQNTVFGAVSALAAEEDGSSIDQVAAASLAANVAQSASIGVEANVANLSTSLNARAELAQSSGDFVSKPQIMSESLKNALHTYKVKRGDSLPSIAANYGVSVDTIKWANNLKDNTISVGSDLRVPAVDGIIYTVKRGDTAKSLASKYKADRERIISFNNAELSGLKPGATIIIPGGVLPLSERPGFTQPSSNYGGYSSSYSVPRSFSPSYSVGYPFGWCTYYAAAKSGAPGNWGNANTWDDYAYATPGWTVSSSPRVGAIAQRDGGYGGLGHVGIVEAVSSDGTKIRYSDMNGLAGFGAVATSGWVSAREYSSYIYR